MSDLLYDIQQRDNRLRKIEARRRAEWMFFLSIILHTLLLYAIFPEFGGGIEWKPPQKKYVVVRRYRPPQQRKKRTPVKKREKVEKRRKRFKPIPDPTPEEPEVEIEDLEIEPEPDDLIPPDAIVVFGEPEGPPLVAAAGPGGLRARVSRHMRSYKRPHWHIDALTSQHQPVAAVMREGEGARECTWVQDLVAMAGASVPANGFGSSDCRSACPAHLLVFPSPYQPLLRLVLTNPPQSLLYCERNPFLSIYDESALLRQIACF